MRIFCINGQRGAGKTTFENYCFALNPLYVKIYSSIDFVKEIAKKVGWDGNKTDKDRAFLGELKQLLINYNDGPFNDVCRYIKLQRDWMEMRDLEPENLIFFIDVRESSEIQKFVDKCGAETILVQRALDKQNDLSAGDCAEDINNYKYDYYITNDGTLDDLEQCARKFMNEQNLINWK